MARKSKPKSRRRRTESEEIAALDPMRTGMPALDSIISVRPMASPEAQALAESGQAPAFRIIRTNEVDGYEKAATTQETLSAALAEAAPVGDKFGGTQRKAAKLSIAAAPTKTFADVRSLVNSLVPDADMANRTPKVSKAATSNRVTEEKRNVRVKAWLYAASRENDNDYHLILGRDPKKSPEVYMTMELSGLPPANAASFDKLKAARDAYKAFFAADLPGLTYDFYDPPIPVRVEGSLFWDAGHATGTRPGPKSLKSRMPVVWEVHPITKIVFNP
ncbi:MAG TPA: hypothetical protein VIT19_04365 [Pyrinomonadaceae bacterium]